MLSFVPSGVISCCELFVGFLTATSLGKFLHAISSGEQLGQFNGFEDAYSETTQANTECQSAVEETNRQQDEQGHQSQTTQSTEASNQIERVETPVTTKERQHDHTELEGHGQDTHYSPEVDRILLSCYMGGEIITTTTIKNNLSTFPLEHLASVFNERSVPYRKYIRSILSGRRYGLRMDLARLSYLCYTRTYAGIYLGTAAWDPDMFHIYHMENGISYVHIETTLACSPWTKGAALHATTFGGGYGEKPEVLKEIQQAIRTGKVQKLASEKLTSDEIPLVGSPTQLFWDCLLYTSPSPRDLSTSRMPSSA